MQYAAFAPSSQTTTAATRAANIIEGQES